MICTYKYPLTPLDVLYMFPAAKEEAKKLMTPPVTPSKHASTSQQTTATPDDVTRHPLMADVASDVIRMRRIKQKLDSVLVNETGVCSFTFLNVEHWICLLMPLHLQETPLSPNYMDTAMLRTPGADSSMFQTPGKPVNVAHPGSAQPGKRPGSVTFQFPESEGRTFRQGMGTNVSLSTWGSDFSPTVYPGYGTSAQSPTMVCNFDWFNFLHECLFFWSICASFGCPIV